MKIAISSTGQSLDSSVDLRFGRASGFIIYNLDDDSHSYIDNVQNLNAAQGAGIQAAQNVINKDVDAIISGNCGPKAFLLISQANIKFYTTKPVSVQEAIDSFKNNDLVELKSANVEGHWM